MITSLKTDEGYLYAVIEWEQIDKERILIKYVWVHENHRGNGAIPGMVVRMAQNKDTHSTDFIGWERGDMNKPLKWYPVYKILQKLRRK